MNHDDKDRTYYEILGVSQTATASEIRKAYREKAQDFHPDKHSNSPDWIQEKAKKRFQELNNAHECLKDDENRHEYDQILRDKDREEDIAQALANEDYPSAVELSKKLYDIDPLNNKYADYYAFSLHKYAQYLADLEKYSDAIEKLELILKRAVDDEILEQAKADLEILAPKETERLRKEQALRKAAEEERLRKEKELREAAKKERLRKEKELREAAERERLRRLKDARDAAERKRLQEEEERRQADKTKQFIGGASRGWGSTSVDTKIGLFAGAR